MDEVRFRPATETDAPSLLYMIQLLAEYQDKPHGVEIKVEDLLRDGFGEECYCRWLLAELKSPLPPSHTHSSASSSSSSSPLPLSASMERDDRIVGYSMYFYNYSTWEGKVMFLEDLFVREEYRSRGYGTAMMKEVAKIAMDTECSRMMLQVLDTNTRARNLYQRLGGEILTWLLVRMYKPQLLVFGDQASSCNGSGEVIYRHATEEDVPALLKLIKHLAADMKQPHGVKIGTKVADFRIELLHDGFGEKCLFKVLLVELASPPVPTTTSSSSKQTERLLGYALYYFTYSAWQGRVINLEDLFVRPEYRDRGYGTRLMKEVAKVGNARGCNRMIWLVEDWNTKAINLYSKVGGTFVKEWLTVKFPKPSLQKMIDTPTT